MEWRRFLEKGFYLLAALSLSMIIYFVGNKIVLRSLNASLTTYQGINNMGKEGLAIYLSRTIAAYKDFFNISRS